MTPRNDAYGSRAAEAEKENPGALKSAASDDDIPGVPIFRTWRGVYLFVFGCFVLVVVALTIFSRVFA